MHTAIPWHHQQCSHVHSNIWRLDRAYLLISPPIPLGVQVLIAV